MKNILKGLILLLGIVLLAGNASAYTFAECMDDQGITETSTFKEKMKATSECQYVIQENVAAMKEKIAEINAMTEIFKACMADEDGNAIDCLAEAGIIDIKAMIQEKIDEIKADIAAQIEALKAEIAAKVEETKTCIKEIDYSSLSKEERQAAIQQCFSILTD